MNNVLKPDWWKHPLPDHLGPQKTNYVLNADEIEAFGTALYKLHTILGSEGMHITTALRAMRGGRVMPSVNPPMPVTLSAMMAVVLEMGKTSKFMLELMNAAVKKRNEANETELRG